MSKLTLNKETKLALKERFQMEGLDTNEFESLMGSLQAMGIIAGLDHNPDWIYQFIKICIMFKKNPLKKEIYAVPYNTRMGKQFSVIIAYQEYLKRAAKNPNYRGFTIETIDTGPDNKKLPLKDVYCVFRCKPANWENEFSMKFYFSEWSKTTGEWNTRPIHMLHVRAIKNGLALCFPDDIAELNQVEEGISVENTGLEKEIKKLDLKEVIGDTNE